MVETNDNDMVKFAMDYGINYIDTADVYSLGESEELIGDAFKGIREDIVLSTKCRALCLFIVSGEMNISCVS